MTARRGRHRRCGERKGRRAGTDPGSPTAPDPAGPKPRPGWAVAIVTTALLLTALDQTSVATALTAIQEDLDTEFAWSGWTLTAFSVGSLVAMPLAGRFSEQFGRRRVFLVGLALFTVGAVLSGTATGIGPLIGFRFLQGLAAGTMSPAAFGLVADQFVRNRDRAIAVVSSIMPVGSMVGPLIGGALVTVASWRLIFLVVAPVGALLLVLAAWLIRGNPRGRGERVDVPGALLLVTALGGGMLAVSLAGAGGAGPSGIATVAAGVAAVLAGCLLVRRSRRHPDPVVPVRLLVGGGFGAVHLVNLIFGLAAFGVLAVVPNYVEARYGFSPVFAGTVLAVRSVTMVLASSCAVALLRRLGHRPLLVAGFTINAAGMVMFAVAPVGMLAGSWLVGCGIVTGAGIGLALPATGNAALHLAPEQVSAIVGLRGMFRQLGGITGISVTTAVVSASAHPDTVQAVAFAVVAALVLAAVPISLRIPNHRGRW